MKISLNLYIVEYLLSQLKAFLAFSAQIFYKYVFATLLQDTLTTACT